jgi:hypothetical protein
MIAAVRRAEKNDYPSIQELADKMSLTKSCIALIPCYWYVNHVLALNSLPSKC